MISSDLFMMMMIWQIIGAFERAIDNISTLIEPFSPHTIEYKENKQKSSDDTDKKTTEDAGKKSGRSNELSQAQPVNNRNGAVRQERRRSWLLGYYWWRRCHLVSDILNRRRRLIVLLVLHTFDLDADGLFA